MGLAVGTRLGPYEILAPLGAGGMGEVYRARDTRLAREVAIKIVPESFAQREDLRARFEREAKTLSSLSHPHICAVFDIGQQDATDYIVLELLEGETLVERLTKGALPLAEALRIGIQIASALDAAHRRGVVHRDLKPGNIMLTKAGAKLLDFGLAKYTPAAAAAASLSAAPTRSHGITEQGVVLGTFQYMAPEQLEAKEADARTDIFALGVVLYEMLTGKPAFSGASRASLIASILAVEPAPMSSVQPVMPPALDHLVRRALAKDPDERWQSAYDIKVELEWLLGGGSQAGAAAPIIPQRGSRRALLWAAMAGGLLLAIVGAIIGAAMWNLRTPNTPPPPVTRFALALGEGEQFTGGGQQIAISPDGTRVAYVANSRLFVRSLSEFTGKVIPGTDLLGGVWNPVFSPDGQFIVFATPYDDTLKRVAVSGGAPVTLCSGAYGQGISWSSDWILFAPGKGEAPLYGIYRVSPNGGTPENVVQLKEDEVAYGPQMLPGGEALLFTLVKRKTRAVTIGGGNPERASIWDSAQIVAQSLKSGERKVLIDGGSDGRYLRTGHIVFANNGVLLVVPFDLHRVEVTGKAVPMVEGVRRSGGAAQFSISDTGSLAYVTGPTIRSAAQLDLGLIDRTGVVTPLKLPPAGYNAARVSPDGKRIAIGSDDGNKAVVWIHELAGTTSMRRLTFGGNNRFPIWSADGQRVAFQSDRDGDLAIFWQRADGNGAAERLTTPDQKGVSHIPEAWSPKGDTLLFRATKDGTASLWTFSMTGKKAAAFGGVQSPVPTDATFSPDGHWVAYAARLEADPERGAVYVQPFPATGAKYQIAPGGRHPVWSRDGKQLLFAIPGGNKYAVVSVTTQPAFSFTNPEPGTRVFEDSLAQTVRSFDIAADGRLVGVVDSVRTPTGAAAPPQINVVLNWFEELKARVPTK